MAIPLILLLTWATLVHSQSLTKTPSNSASTCHCYHLSRLVQGDWGSQNMKDFHLVAPKGFKIVVRTDSATCWKAERVFFTRARLVSDATGQVVNAQVATGEVTTSSSLSGTHQTSPLSGSQVPGSDNEVAVDSISWANSTGEPNPPPNPTDTEAQGGGGLNLQNPPAGQHYDFVHTFMGWRFCYPGRSVDGVGPFQRLSWYVTKSGGRTAPKATSNSAVLTGQTATRKGGVKGGGKNATPPTTPSSGPPTTPAPNPDPVDPADPENYTPPTPPADPTGEPGGGVIAATLDPDAGNPDPLPIGVVASFEASGYKGLDYDVIVSTTLDPTNDLGVDPSATPPASWNVTLTGGSGSFAAGPHVDSDSATVTLKHTGGAPAGTKLYLVLVLHDPAVASEDMWSDVETVNLP